MTHFIGGRFRLREKIGSGSFGEIHVGDDVKSSSPVAIKIEQLTCQTPQLENESNAYINLSGGVNIPKHYYFGTEQTYKAMVIDLEGSSVEDKLKSSGGRFSLKTVLMLIDQMLTSIEFIHRKGYIHRDIKPDNFMFGTKKNENQLYVIDFGLAKKYKNIDGSHIPFKEHTPLTGTARYASVNSLSGVEQSRRDDMESLAYIFVYLFKGSLPWMGVQTGNLQQKYDKICSIKKSTQPEDLCSGMPNEFSQFLSMIKKLKFDEQPEYAKYRQMFRDLLLKNEFSYDYKYDWVKHEPKVRSIKRAPLSINQKSSKQPIKFHKSNFSKGKDDSSNRNLNSSPNININVTTNSNANDNDKGNSSDDNLQNNNKLCIKLENKMSKQKISSSALNISTKKSVSNKKDGGNNTPQHNQQKISLPLPTPSPAAGSPAAVHMHSMPIPFSSFGKVPSPTNKNRSNYEKEAINVMNKTGNRAGSVKITYSSKISPAKSSNVRRDNKIGSAQMNQETTRVLHGSEPNSPKRTNTKLQKR